jgi:ribosomal protein S18 acetylase RimI-like enzyme
VHGHVAELAYAYASEAYLARVGGSNPLVPTMFNLNEITIRLARSEDARALQEVYYKSWLKTYPNEKYGITTEDIEDSYKNSFTPETIKSIEERIGKSPSSDKRFAVVINNKVIGTCRIILNTDRNELRSLYLLPEYQGKGIGTVVWNYVKKYLDSTKETFLNVAVYNETAISFYEKLGFKDSGKRFSEEKFRMKSGNIIPEMEMLLERSK